MSLIFYQNFVYFIKKILLRVKIKRKAKIELKSISTASPNNNLAARYHVNDQRVNNKKNLIIPFRSSHRHE